MGIFIKHFIWHDQISFLTQSCVCQAFHMLQQQQIYIRLFKNPYISISEITLHQKRFHAFGFFLDKVQDKYAQAVDESVQRYRATTFTNVSRTSIIDGRKELRHLNATQLFLKLVQQNIFPPTSGPLRVSTCVSRTVVVLSIQLVSQSYDFYQLLASRLVSRPKQHRNCTHALCIQIPS